ncbi:MAG: phosphate ABC transporter permease subunit PstC [Candidatus Altiarchaeota archaeon]|nr:phosphate ABC transporter permease subunit PstC [Candidatus Altiarchaeota archaeon]
MNKQEITEKAAKGILFLSSISAVLILFLIIMFLFKEGLPLFAKTSPIDFIAGNRWLPGKDVYGALPFIAGTVYITAGAILIATPLGIACALFLAQVAPKKAKSLTRPAIELLAGIPSIVYGLLATVIIVRFLKVSLDLATGETMLAGSIILAVMILPTIISVSQDSIESVPKALKEGSYALGSTDTQTMWHVTVPTAMPGILASIILGMGRAIGETMAVVLVIGNSKTIPGSVLEPGIALTSGILLEMPEAAVGSLHYSALFCLGIILFLIVFVLSLISNHIVSGRRTA